MNFNARPYPANIVDECLQSQDITRMDWPAYSPDLNPIKHEWDMLGRRIGERQPPPTFLPELRTALLDDWCNIPQGQIDNVILSMPMRFGESLISPVKFKTSQMSTLKTSQSSLMGCLLGNETYHLELNVEKSTGLQCEMESITTKTFQD
ncbi:transposable element Tc3 transposase [Trichonephila clavipes]|nr:transposable element Tc3 transposase [Trichonephila clavipes]